MGHYASEVDPNWGKELEANARIRDVKEKLKDKPLSSFKAGDIPNLVTLFGYHEYMSESKAARELKKYA